SRTEANDWCPTLAADAKGSLWVAFDTYEGDKGGYDVRLVRVAADGAADSPVLVAASPKFEARPSVAVGPPGRAWGAYEEGTESGGKDAVNLVKGQGPTLYRTSAVRVRCLDGERLLDAPEVPRGPGPNERDGYPRLAVDGRGAVWLAYRNRQEAIWGN